MPPAIHVKRVQALGHGIGQAAGLGLRAVQPHVRLREVGQGGGEVLAHFIDQVTVKKHRVVPLPQPAVAVLGNAVQVAHLHRHAVGRGNRGQLAELACRHVAGGNEQHRQRRLLRRGRGHRTGRLRPGRAAAQCQQPGTPELEKFFHCSQTNPAGGSYQELVPQMNNRFQIVLYLKSIFIKRKKLLFLD